MHFLRLKDHLLSILFENEDILAIDKPYGLSSHTNDPKAGNLDYIHDGLIEIFERQLQKKLHIIHRLDQTTTGVIIFAKSTEAAKKYADYFFQRQVKKNYLFITANHSSQDYFEVDLPILYKGKELEARTLFKRLKKTNSFELWQANPLTGRNHQIRIHAESVGLSLLGDEKYNGANYPFLCLHNQRIEFPNGLILESSPPPYFTDLALLENQILAKALFESDRRLRLFASADPDQCYRLVHNKNDFKNLGFTIDQFGSVLVLSCYDEKWLESDQKMFSHFATWIKKTIIVRLMHNRGKDPLHKSQLIIYPDPAIAASHPLESNWVAKENHLQFQFRSDSGQSFGLFLDQRLQRNWVFHHAKGRSVLNLFSYTCGFSVAAALGEASQVTSVDTSKNVLNWGKTNFTLNGIDPNQHKFLNRDSIDYLQQCLNKNIKYDLIICDPPSFSRGEKGVFKIETSLEPLLKNCLSCLNPQGVLLFSTNYENFYIDDIRKSILKVQDHLKIPQLEINCIHSGLDFELSGKPTILKSFLIKN